MELHEKTILMSVLHRYAQDVLDPLCLKHLVSTQNQQQYAGGREIEYQVDLPLTTAADFHY